MPIKTGGKDRGEILNNKLKDDVGCGVGNGHLAAPTKTWRNPLRR